MPLSLVENKLDELIVDKLGLKTAASRTSTTGATCCIGCAIPSTKSRIAVVGKYAEHRDAYKSIYEALDHAGIAPSRAGPHPAHSKRGDRARRARAAAVAATTAFWCPAASASAASKARSRRFASPASAAFRSSASAWACSARSIEFGRNVVRPGRRPLDRVRQGHAAPGDLPARRAEDDHRQGRHDAAGRPAGAARSGEQVAATATARPTISERHRHRYEFNNVYRQQFDGPRHAVRGHEPRRFAGRNHRAARPSLVRGRAVPSGIQIEADGGRTRCSPASSAPPWKNTPPANGRRPPKHKIAYQSSI